ncbi:hypothetical protein GA0061100_1011190 [Rhizobium hainanense]|uniref:Uncharacterized protein n=1 Tax=Rhizobium hainanense TaxID=52131 RepID=A0A1C3UBP9_9HYPH|nr:hypothetical protein GA0061100_1011190 [Rhizobium hainanense]
MNDLQDKPLTLTLSPQAGKGDDLPWRSLSSLAKVRGDGECAHPLLPVKTGRRWPIGRMRGSSRNARAGVMLEMHITAFGVRGEITPPRTFGPTLRLNGRVR